MEREFIFKNLGYGIFTAKTNGFKGKFSASYGIKIFTWYRIRPEVRKFFGLKSIEDCPTHSIVYGEKTESGSQLLFEANKTMELNYAEHTYPTDEGMKLFSYVIDGILTRDMDAFKKLVGDKGNHIYGIAEWLNYIRAAFLWWIFKKDVKGKHQYFADNDVCSEITARDNMNHPCPVMRESLLKIDFNNIAPSDLFNTTYDGIKAKEVGWINKPM
jgi:hypothetical protein